MRKSSISLAINEKQTEASLRFHFTPVRTAHIKKINNKADEDVVKKGPLNTVGGNVKYCNHYGNQYGESFKN
jgi:hypothetical protein